MRPKKNPLLILKLKAANLIRSTKSLTEENIYSLTSIDATRDDDDYDETRSALEQSRVKTTQNNNNNNNRTSKYFARIR